MDERQLSLARPSARLALLIATAWATPAGAALSDTFHPFVAVEYAYDDNLLRLTDDPRNGDLSDRSRATIAGISFQRPVSQQMFTGSVKVTNVTFDRFTDLDYVGKDAALNWHWKVGPHLEGQLGGSYEESLSSFNDYHGSQRNLRTQRGEYAEANWTFHPSWRLHGRLNREEYAYDLLSQRVLDRDENGKEAGIDYLAASGSTIGLVARETKGDYPNARMFGATLLDDGYKQRELKLKVLWKLNAVTELQFLGGHAERVHDRYSTRDASGTNGRLTASWAPTGSVRLLGSAWREFAPFEGSNATYSLNQGASVDGSWQITAKIQATAALKYLKREFVGQQGLNVPLDSRDTGRTVNLGLSYAPASYLTLNASVYRDTRSAAVAVTSGYRANGGSVSASFQF